MTPAPGQKTAPLWNRPQQALLLSLLLASAAMLTASLGRGRHWSGNVPPPDPSRVEDFSEKIDLNTAPTVSLQRLPRIGPALAAAIVRERNAHGPFNRVEDVCRVPGISDHSLARFREFVVVPSADSGTP